MALMIPLLMLVLYAAVEASQGYLLKEALSQAAREAARNCAIAYGQDPLITSSRARVDYQCYSVRIQGVVNNTAQFDDPQWDMVSTPPRVTVTVHYRGNQYGLAPFPNPDVLNLGSNFQLSSAATYRLK